MFPISLISIAQETVKTRMITNGMTKTKFYENRLSKRQRVYPNRNVDFENVLLLNQSLTIC